MTPSRPPETDSGGAARVELPSRLESNPADTFVGREQELRVLQAALDDARSQRRCQVVLISGEPGIGKTSLAGEFARTAWATGATALYGACDDDLTVPYRPWADAISHLVVHGRGGHLDDVLAAKGGDLARLGPALRSLATQLGGSADPEAARYLLFGAVRAVLSAAAADAPLVVVIDDLHGADDPTLQLLRHLINSQEPGPLLVIGTFRDSEVDANHPLAEMLARIRSDTSVTRIVLRGLEERELLALLREIAGHDIGDAGADLGRTLGRDTDGNPFFFGELLRHLVDTGHISHDPAGSWVLVGTLGEHGLPVSVREVVARRLARLGEQAEHVLSVASVTGRTFELGAVAQAASVTEEEALNVLDAAVAASLVVNDTADQYSFKHALVERCLYDALTPARRSRAHRRVAETIEARWADDLGPRVGELAWHYARAVTTQDIGKAISYAKAAGDRSLAQLAPGDALRWYRQALDLLDEQPDEQMTARILVRVGDAQRQTGDPSFRETLLTAGRLAAEHDDTPSLIEAALANNRGIQSATGRVDEDRVQAIEAALSAVGADDTADRARLLSLLALERTFDGDYDGRRAIADEALAMAERLGDKATLLDVLHRRHQPIWIPDTLPDRLLDTARGDELATALGDPIGLFWSAMLRKSDALEAGDLAEVSRCLDVVAAVAADVGQPTLAWTSAFSEAWRILLTGDATRAEAQADEALRLGNETGQPDALTIYLGQVAAVRWHQGRTDELVDAVATVAVDNPGLPAVRALYAHMAVDAGREDEARKLLSAEVSAGFPHPRDLLLLCNLSYWAEVAARLADPVAAEMLYERLTPWPAHVGFTGATVVGAAAHYLGMLAAVLGPHEAADVHFTQALEIHRGLGAPFHLARTHVEWGRALLADGQVDAARTNLEAARGLAAQHGCGLVLLRADALLEATAGPT